MPGTLARNASASQSAVGSVASPVSVPIADMSSAWPVSAAPSRSGNIAQRWKSSTSRPIWSIVVIRNAARPVGARPGFAEFCFSPTTSVRVNRVSPMTGNRWKASPR